MRFLKNLAALSVILLTLSSASLLGGCSYINKHYSEPCNSRAYSRTVLSDFLSSRFHSDARVRMAVIPLSVPANISDYNTERPGLGNELAWKIQAEFLRSGQVPVVEILNRHDWPGKKNEFFAGDFGAIATAREAGYDLVFVGYLRPMRSLDSMTAYTKVIEIDSGITIWYGETTVTTYEPDLQRIRASLFLEDPRPDKFYMGPLTDRLASCIVKAIASEEE